uniref:NADH-ubiquinone oxidoreductase chain 6 n=1 Tax=Bostrichoidea sp. 2 KM-2017 TaxID=2219276 RepID=A0A346RJM0_9COLE|nr:NADH dehydrogenase subunit 6 [Bostrichoidea sp. 2 KM-2017]
MLFSILLTTTIIMSMSFVMLNHPLSMSLVLLIQTLSITMSSGMMNISFWYSYIMFLIMIGGMLVLFMYMTSIASNEKFKFSKTILMMSILLTLPVLSISMIMNTDKTHTFNNQESMKFTETELITESMTKFINQPSNMIMYMIIIYLLITLIAVVKITNTKMGALRQKS